MFTSLRLGRILNPTAITESDPYWSCCLGNAPLRLILETPQKKKNNNIEFGAPHLINVYDGEIKLNPKADGEVPNTGNAI